MKQQENRAVIAWRGAANAGWFHQQIGVYESPRPSYNAELRDKVSRTCGYIPVKIEMGGKPF